MMIITEGRKGRVTIWFLLGYEGACPAAAWGQGQKFFCNVIVTQAWGEMLYTEANIARYNTAQACSLATPGNKPNSFIRNSPKGLQ
jgi:hypothetical protein